jgi:hypothetical protein
MTNFFQKILSGLTGSEEAETPETSERLEEYEQIFKLAKKKNLSADKKAELETLYTQLIRKSDNVTSGQLQFLGLAEIKEKMGARWPKLQSKVYAAAEEVIQRYVTLSDIYFLFKEDRYVIIFTQSSDEEINRKVAAISDEIMRRFAEFEEEEMQTLQISQEIKKVDVETFLDNEFSDMLDYVFKQYNPGYQPGGLSLDTPTARTAPKVEISLVYQYLPLWDVDKKSLSTFLCLSQDTEASRPIFEGYKALFQNKTLQEKTAFDIAMLERIVNELEKMEYEEREAVLICPVQHETLYNFSSYDEFKNICQTIPNSQRESLIFLVTNAENFSLPAKDPYWFVPLLKDYCGGVYIDVPMRENMVFSGLKNSGAAGMGVQYTSVMKTEEENLHLLSGFMSQVKYLRMKRTFAWDITNLNSAQSLARMGFSYLGGPAICGHSLQPERYLDNERRIILTNLAK